MRISVPQSCVKHATHSSYCKSGIFGKNFIFKNGVKRHICDDFSSRSGYDLPISVNDRMISPFRKDFIFTKLCICEVL